MDKMVAMNRIMQKIRNLDELYVVMSPCTHMPFVYCEPETCDDEVFLYFGKDEALKGAQWFLKNGHPVQAANIPKDKRLYFFTGLYLMGVNAIVVNRNVEQESSFPLEMLVLKQKAEDMHSVKMRVENPALHLTCLYFAQELRKRLKPGAGTPKELPEELKALEEEVIAHFCRAKLIIAVEEGKGIPLMKKNGETYQPVFTDIREFEKFNRDRRFSASLLGYEKLREILHPEVVGVTINPLGTDVVLKFVA